MGQIFISHATKDVELVRLFVGLLQTGLSIDHKQIFCTSLEGMTIPQGKQFVDYIRTELTAADYVIMLVTPSYYESPFCMCELGATWVRAVGCSPLVVPPITYDNLQGVLHGTQVGHINDGRSLSEMHDALVKLKICEPSSARWEYERDTFIKQSAKVIGTLSGRTQIPAAEYNALQDKYELAQEKIAENEEDIQKKDNYIKELEGMKDQTQVRAARKKYKSHRDEFNALKATVVESVSILPSAAVEALFHHTRDEEYVLPSRYGNDHLYEDVNDAAKDEYVTVEGSVVTVDSGHPEMSSALEAVSNLSEFMEEADEDLFAELQQEYSTKVSITNRQFWYKAFGL